MLEYKIKDENLVFLNAAIALQTIAGQHPFVNQSTLDLHKFKII